MTSKVKNEDGYNLSDTEIKSFMRSVEKKYHLQLYKALKHITLPPQVTKKEVEKLKKDVKAIFQRKDIPRLLTEEEVEEIVQIIPTTPATFEEISQDIRRQIMDTLRRQLSVHKIVVKKDTIQKMKDIILEKFYKSHVAVGESVGTNAAVSIGQPITQATLNTFHSTGSKSNVGEGVSFIERLFNLSSTGPKTAVIHFKDKNKTKEEIYRLGRTLRGVSVAMLIKKTKLMEKINEEDKQWYDDFHTIYNIDKTLETSTDQFMRLYINSFKCYKYEISIMDIARTIEQNNRVPGIKQSVKCIVSDSYTGIIDVYVSKDFVKRETEKFSQTMGKGRIISNDINELIAMFLNNLLTKKFNDMYIKGIQNVQGFNVSDALVMTSTFLDIEIDNAKDLEKFSSEPFNLEMKDIDFLWRIRITKYHVLFTGLNEQKFVDLIEAAGMEIIENNFHSETPNFVILMPHNRKVKFWNKEENKAMYKYKKLDNGQYKDMESGKISKFFGPKKLIEEQVQFIEEMMYREITDILLENKDPVFPEIPPLYRYAYYYYAIIDDGDIIADLFNNKLIDPVYTYPNDVHRIYELFGIEATRFYLSSKYNSLEALEKVNPANIESLINFQTAYGVPLPVTSNGLAKQGSSILTSAAFQDSMTFLDKGAAFGTTDHIIGISSSIMSGSRCKNGTGMVNVDYDDEYLNDPTNKFTEDETVDLQMNISDIKGPCYLRHASADDSDNEAPFREDRAQRGTGLKERIPSPPRMAKSAIFDDEILDIGEMFSEPPQPDVSENFSLDLDIPELAPGPYEIDDIL